MIRIISRVFGWESNRRRLREDPRLWEYASWLVPQGTPRASITGEYLISVPQSARLEIPAAKDAQ